MEMQNVSAPRWPLGRVLLFILVLLVILGALLVLTRPRVNLTSGGLSAADQARIREQLSQPRPDLALSPTEQARIRAKLQSY